VEIRSPDGSAFFNLLLAGMATAAEWGLTSRESLALAEQTRVVGNIFSDPDLISRLEPLPMSCVATARLLDASRGMYERDGVFPPVVIDHVIAQLQREDDEKLNPTLARMPAEERLHATRQVMHREIHRS
jgi:glutamine synthetase